LATGVPNGRSGECDAYAANRLVRIGVLQTPLSLERLMCGSQRKKNVVEAAGDPREVEAFIRPLPARLQLVYCLAVRGLCACCRGDRVFRKRTDALVEQAALSKKMPLWGKRG
jgi:hypothetical protein